MNQPISLPRTLQILSTRGFELHTTVVAQETIKWHPSLMKAPFELRALATLEAASARVLFGCAHPLDTHAVYNSSAAKHLSQIAGGAAERGRTYGIEPCSGEKSATTKTTEICANRDWRAFLKSEP